MYKVLALVGGRRTLYLGLTALDRQEMADGQRSTIPLDALVKTGRLGGGVDDVVLFAGENDEACHAQLAASMSLPDYRPLGNGVLVYAPPVGR